jgi:hypothetical protein
VNPLAELTKIERGFELIEFTDIYGKPCTLQQSSAAIYEGPPGSSAVWLGQGDDRMHLSHEQVIALVAHLSAWLQTGSFQLNQKG